MDYDGFINKYLGKSIDYDGVYSAQCVDLVVQYCVDNQKPIAWANAKDWANHPALRPAFDWINNNPNDPNQLPLRGDIVVFSGSQPGSEGYGHINLYDMKTGRGRWQGLDQNWGGKTVHFVPDHVWTYVLGWWHVKETPIAPPALVTPDPIQPVPAPVIVVPAPVATPVVETPQIAPEVVVVAVTPAPEVVSVTTSPLKPAPKKPVATPLSNQPVIIGFIPAILKWLSKIIGDKMLKKAWNFLNGKKTFIGAVLSTVYFFAVGQNWITYDQSVVDVLNAVFGIGVAHKIAKYVIKTS